MDLAWTSFLGTTYVARHVRKPFEPHSALTRLVQGIWGREPEMARKILRGRISTTLQSNPMDDGMLRVAAKRVSWNCATPDENSQICDVSQWALPTASGSESENLFERDRKVSAILVNADGEVIFRAQNTNARDRTRHAEVNLIQGWWAEYESPIPSGSRLYVSLKPCKMCAGMIWESCMDPQSLRVIYMADDPGPMARDTMIESIQSLNVADCFRHGL